ncbi:hypothetical protein KP509_22G059400 [Ceratopteris richardii]|uniref:Uncharacterized protein n=1 Tax=Ceratopteris richardii TaxID=49495 RepID=A0A8T2S8I2_CERRI|nr:hypothetical protein KP509_22G059400 [Ceratopteris richardii]
MAAECDFIHHIRSASTVQEFYELYTRAREAVEESQKQGNLQLQAAMEAAISCPSLFHVSSLSSAYKAASVERVNCQTSNFSSENKDIIPMMFQFVMRVALICLIFHTRTDLVTLASRVDGGGPHLLIRLVAFLWITAVFAAMPIMLFQPSSWCDRSCGIVLLLPSSILWLGETVLVLVSCSHLALDIVHILSQCIFSSILHQAPFSSHLKARLFGFGLQTIVALAIVSKAYKALPAVLYFSLSHSLGVALAYMSHHSSVSCFTLDRKFTDCQLSLLCNKKRALGGFAGGFAGVSGLNFPHSPSAFTDLSSAYSSSLREDYLSETSFSSSSTLGGNTDSLLTQQDYFAYSSSSDQQSIQGSNADARSES